MLLLIGLLLTIAGALFFNASFPLSRYYENLIAIPLLIMAQIVLLSQVLSILHWLNTPGYMAGHGILFMLSVALWWRRGRPSLAQIWQVDVKKTLTSVTPHIYLSILALLALIAVIFQAIDGIVHQSYFVDANIYHLPRAAFWLQYNTAEHFTTLNFRMTEFPPNASFISAWMMALDGLHTALNLPQVVAVLMGALATLGLAHVAGFRLDASIFAGTLLLFNTEILLQLNDAQIDVLVAALTAVYLYFIVVAIQAHQKGTSLSDNKALIYMAIAFGLVMGTKFTAPFMLPGAAMAFAVYTIATLRQRALSILSACLVAAIAGFMVFGSYNYILNTLSFGNPITSQDMLTDSSNVITPDSATDTDYIERLLDPAANMVRYLYQMIGIEVYAVLLPVDAQTIVQTKDQVFETIFGEPGLHIDYRIREGQSLRSAMSIGTYQLLFAVPFVLIPLLLLYFLLRSRHSTAHRLAALYLFCAVSWLVVMSSITAWSSLRMRLFVILLPPVAAAVFPWLYSRKWYAKFWLIPLLLVAASNLLFSITPSNTIRQTNYTNLVQMLVPSGGTVALVDDQMATFPLQRDIDDVTFIHMTDETIRQALQSGEVDALLTDSFRCDMTFDGMERVSLPLEVLRAPECIFTQPELVRANEHIEQQVQNGVTRLRVEPGAHLAGLLLYVPMDYANSHEGLQITFHTEDAVPVADVFGVRCDYSDMPQEAVTVDDNQVQIQMSPERVESAVAKDKDGFYCEVSTGLAYSVTHAIIEPLDP